MAWPPSVGAVWIRKRVRNSIERGSNSIEETLSVQIRGLMIDGVNGVLGLQVLLDDPWEISKGVVGVESSEPIVPCGEPLRENTPHWDPFSEANS